MLASPRTDSITSRLEPYIEELRDFLISRHLPLGTPGSLRIFLDGLTDPAFHEEMVSMVRSILYREETLPRIELMEIIAVAAAGPQALEDTPELRQPLREILAFVQQVARAKSGFIVGQTLTPEEDIINPPETTATPHILTASAIAAAAAADTTSVPHPEQFTLTNDHLSRSLLYLQSSSEPQDLSAPANPGQHPIPVFTHPPALHTPGTRSTLAGLLHRSYWIPGVIVLLMAIAVVSLLDRGTTAQKIAPPRHPSSIITSSQRKPSAYGNTLPPSLPAQPSPEPVTTAQSARSASPRRGLYASPSLATAPSPRVFPQPTHSTVKTYAATPRRAIINPLAPREGVFLASSGAMASHLLSAPAPGYPRLASLTHTEGQVIVQVVVSRDGSVMATRVLDGPRLLRGAAEHAIRNWRYRPYFVDGQATDVATIVTVSFRLR